jgi:porphobilinogen synthase
MSYSIKRHRRLRNSEGIRRLVRENHLTMDQLIYPLFVTSGNDVKREIPSMPGIHHLSIDRLEEELAELQSLGINTVLLFGIPEFKDESGSSAFDDEGVVQRAIRIIKHNYPNFTIIADTCVCQYTSHGHCGIVEHHSLTKRVEIMNDPSLDLHVKTAISQARAGADIIAPSNMMDGFVAAIRQGLDENELEHVPIMSYAVKYASAYYGPFREAASSTPQFGDRKTYQMDPANAREALREAQSDVMEGADFLMVKPALAYLDIIRSLREQFQLPIVAYNVSGEYSMVKAAAMQGWLDERAVVMETLIGMKRAGADLIITYHAKEVARWLSSSSAVSGHRLENHHDQ